MTNVPLNKPGPEFRRLERDLIDIGREVERDLKDELKKVGTEVAARIRSSTADPYLTGELRRSVKVGLRSGVVRLYSKLPQANVVHWGGTIRPRGVPIRFKPTWFVRGPIERQMPVIEQKLARAFDIVARKHGFH